MTHSTPSQSYRERLTPGPWMFVTLLLLVPAVILVMIPLNESLAIPLAIVLYVIFAGSLVMLAPIVSVENGVLTAGTAKIPLELLGEVKILEDDQLRLAIGPGLDARAHLMVRGYIHRAIRVAVNDPADPAPYWVVTTRKPQTLQAAIAAGRAGR